MERQPTCASDLGSLRSAREPNAEVNHSRPGYDRLEQGDCVDWSDFLRILGGQTREGSRPLSGAEVLLLEQHLGRTWPEDYRAFVLGHGDTDIWRSEALPNWAPSHFRSEGLLELLEQPPTQEVPFAFLQSGEWLALDLAAARFGTIRRRASPGSAGDEVLAPSFTSLLKAMVAARRATQPPGSNEEWTRYLASPERAAQLPEVPAGLVDAAGVSPELFSPGNLQCAPGWARFELAAYAERALMDDLFVDGSDKTGSSYQSTGPAAGVWTSWERGPQGQPWVIRAIQEGSTESGAPRESVGVLTEAAFFANPEASILAPDVPDDWRRRALRLDHVRDQLFHVLARHLSKAGTFEALGDWRAILPRVLSRNDQRELYECLTKRSFPEDWHDDFVASFGWAPVEPPIAGMPTKVLDPD